MAIGVLTGSGTYALPGFTGEGPAPVTTPWGEALVSRGEWAGVEVLLGGTRLLIDPRVRSRASIRFPDA